MRRFLALALALAAASMIIVPACQHAYSDDSASSSKPTPLQAKLVDFDQTTIRLELPGGDKLAIRTRDVERYATENGKLTLQLATGELYVVPMGTGPTGPSDSGRGAPLFVEEGISVFRISSKAMTKADNSGDIWFSVRAVVKNGSSLDRDIRLEVKAIDGDDFELEDLTLSGSLKNGEQTTLSDKNYMSYRDFASIERWVVSDFSSRVYTGDSVSVTGIKTRKTSQPDSSGDIWFSLKATVRNNSTDDDVSITIQAIDREGYELKDVTLSGKVRHGQIKVLTDKKYMPYDKYRSIARWRVKG